MRVVTELATEAALGSKNAAERLERIVRGQEAEPPITGQIIRDELEHEQYKPLPLKTRRKLLDKRRRDNR